MCAAPGSELEVTALRVVTALRRLEIPFHLTGGIASAFHGEPRFTQDIDIVVQLTEASARDLVRALVEDFVVQEAAAMEAVRRGTSFQALDRRTFIKVGLHLGGKIPGELARSVVQPVFEGAEVRQPHPPQGSYEAQGRSSEFGSVPQESKGAGGFAP